MSKEYEILKDILKLTKVQSERISFLEKQTDNMIIAINQLNKKIVEGE